MDLALQILSIQFVFDWVIVTILAVSWTYLFDLGFPNFSQHWYGWLVFFVILLGFSPLVQAGLLRYMRSHDQEFQEGNTRVKATRGWALILFRTSGMAVGTSLLQVLATGFAYYFNLGMPIAFSLAMGVVATAIYLAMQGYLEHYLHTKICSDQKNGYFGSLLSIILISTWGILGFFWNVIWNEILLRLNGVMTIPTSGGSNWNSINQCSGGASLGQGFLWAKAAVTIIVATLFLWAVPALPPLGEGTSICLHIKRRGVLAMQMIPLVLAGYATGAAGYNFGITYVTSKTGSAYLGYTVATLYAISVTLLGVGMGWYTRFAPKYKISKWYFQVIAYVVCYSWWYLWLGVLTQVQGFGLVNAGVSGWLLWILECLFAILITLLQTYVVALGVVWLTKYKIGHRKLSPGSEEECMKKIGSDSVSDSMRFLMACSGVLVSQTPEEEEDQPWTIYQSTELTTEGLAMPVAADGGGAL